ncbi:MAG: hypothetical protein GF317_19075 [Candidatus Lokiarchaeota archaeon]|nr:hypothetical protein [Candidatus Lokiarchaeota archaeon]MBD3201615.1 hypothetical protein [Candidatus Lokiarchaeota archaeon]
MTEENAIDNKEESEDDEIIKEEIKIQYHWYFIGFVTTYFLTWAIPGVIFFLYIFFAFVPFFLETTNFFLIFTELGPLLSLISFPLVIVICDVLHLVIATAVTRFWWNISQNVSPTKDGIIPRNIRSTTSNLYHIRSFLIKYPKYAITKGMFPWLFNWAFNSIGATKIGKGSTIEEQVVGDRLVEVGDNCYVGPNASLASHLVEGIFGNIYYFTVRLGDNCTVGAETALAPGSELEDNSYIFPCAASLKFTQNKGFNYYFGMPIRKIFSRKIKDYLDLTKEDLKRSEELELRYKERNEK